MKPLVLMSAMGLALLAGPAGAQYGGGNIGTGGYQTGTVDRPVDEDEAKIGVDDGSGIIQGPTELRRNKSKKKKVKDPNCREEKKNGYRVSNCW
jgi:hypothetical protein